MKSEGKRQNPGGSERTSSRVQGIRYGLVAVFICVMILSFTRNSLAGAPESSGNVRVRVYNYAQASPATLAEAEREAVKIFSEAGVETLWLDCLTVEPGTERQQLCQLPRGPAEVVVRILVKPTENGFRDTVFGTANVPALASVYYSQALLLAQADSAQFEVPTILGCAMAHEIGHLLLGTNSHSEMGIMRGQWGRKDVQQALMGRRLFTTEQAKLIRVEVRRRAALPTASSESAFSFPAK